MASAPPGSLLRVLYVNHVGFLGGAEKSLLALMEALPRRQVEAHLAAPEEGGLTAAARELGFPVHPLPTCRLHRPKRPWDYLRAYRTFRSHTRALRPAVRGAQPDLIHANSLIAAWGAARVASVPIIWHCRDLEFPARIAQAVRPRVAAVIAISQAVADSLESPSWKSRPTRVIYNGLSPRDVHVTRRRSQVREGWEMGADTPLIGCMGQLIPWKRQDLLLRALPAVLAQAPEARLVMLGADNFGEHPDYVAALGTLAQELGVHEHVLWAFADRPADALAALDVLAHPADREPFGRVVLEALALGVPVVAINRAGPAEIIEDGISGLLVPPDDPAALAQAIVRLLQDEDLRDTISDGARIRASHFSAHAMAARVFELYEEVLAE